MYFSCRYRYFEPSFCGSKFTWSFFSLIDGSDHSKCFKVNRFLCRSSYPVSRSEEIISQLEKWVDQFHWSAHGLGQPMSHCHNDVFVILRRRNHSMTSGASFHSVGICRNRNLWPFNDTRLHTFLVLFNCINKIFTFAIQICFLILIIN